MMTGVRGEVRGDLGCFEIGWNGFLKADLQRMLVLREGDAHEKGVLRRQLSRAGLHPVQEVEVDRAPFGRVDTVLYSERQRQASEGQKQASEGQGQALGQGQGQGCCARKGLLTQSLATNCFGVKCAAAGILWHERVPSLWFRVPPNCLYCFCFCISVWSVCRQISLLFCRCLLGSSRVIQGRRGDRTPQAKQDHLVTDTKNH